MTQGKIEVCRPPEPHKSPIDVESITVNPRLAQTVVARKWNQAACGRDGELASLGERLSFPEITSPCNPAMLSCVVFTTDLTFSNIFIEVGLGLLASGCLGKGLATGVKTLGVRKGSTLPWCLLGLGMGLPLTGWSCCPGDAEEGLVFLPLVEA